MTRLLEVARRGGSIAKSWRSQILTARTAGDSKAENHAANKVLISLLTHKPYRNPLLKDKRTPIWVRDESNRRYKAYYRADLRRIGSKKADEKWKGSKPLSFKMKSYSDRIGEALATGWIAVGENGFPGLCFMSDELLSELLGWHRRTGLFVRCEDFDWKTFDGPESSGRQTITQAHMEKLFDGGKRHLVLKHAAKELEEITGLQHTACYNALSRTGRFSANLKDDNEGLLYWQAYPRPSHGNEPN